MKYKCPCCGCYTFSEKPNGNYDICPVCFWEDDPLAYKDHDYAGGSNKVSLNEARVNYKLFGACTREMISNVRKATSDEVDL